MQIKDRNTEFPNRRRLEVEEIEYNENGEIEVLLVEVKRDEGEVYEEGTQINATNLDLIIRSKVTEILSMSDEERVEYDASKIELELEVDVEAITQDFSLPTKGINGSSIVWSVEGEGIEIEENIARVNRKLYEQNPLLKARVSYGSAETIQVFHVTVLLREMTPINGSPVSSTIVPLTVCVCKTDCTDSLSILPPTFAYEKAAGIHNAADNPNTTGVRLIP